MVQSTVESQERQGDSRPRARRGAQVWLAVVAAVALVLDLASKELATKLLDPAEPVKLLGGALYLSLTRNAGAAFSLFRDFTFVFPIITLGVVVWIGWMARTLRSMPWAISLGLVLGGALGNLVDRLFRAPAPFHGHVVDFFSLFDPHGQVWPIFNVADMALVSGVVLAVLLELLGRHRDGTRIKEKNGG
ncbi:signal peptidase II [Allorhizocola rhizosphaerae]|uniref:signal peptidase II n=1 Tax=Allorhizocola rhizosphaerae TaxID=1872709 RepID=UPI000E3C1EB2|nr:signal peptidase II [Allorhizocola rhizosphaerae]